MLVVAVATEHEMKPLQPYFANMQGMELVVTGVGPVAAAVNLSSYLARQNSVIDGVLNIGVAGAYVACQLELLDICLARQEVLGDFGICMQDEILDFDPKRIQPSRRIALENTFLGKIEEILKSAAISYKVENFVTVNCCSGTKKRGAYLQEKFTAGCENMEGAAVAMVCEKFNIPCVEMRCVSNMVEDRNRESWKLDEAVEKICSVAGIVLQEYLKAEAHDQL